MKRQGDEKEDQDFSVNPEYSTYSNIEGLALLKALQEKDKKKALEYFKDYSLARETKHKFMTPGAIAFETNTTILRARPTIPTSRWLCSAGTGCTNRR